MSLVETLHEHERAWNERPLVRRLYHEWFELVRESLANVEGETIELGSGLGRLKEVVPGVITTDVEPTPWSERTVDAASLPWPDGSLANIVLVDVFHHLADPAEFLDEAVRVLAPGGRVVLLEPHVSPLSRLGYRLHHERLEFGVDPFAPQKGLADDPLEGNLALSSLAFFRRADALVARWPALAILRRRRFAWLLYPLSGGFTRRPLVPSALAAPLAVLERALDPLVAPVAAFRCLVVLERR